MVEKKLDCESESWVLVWLATQVTIDKSLDYLLAKLLN